VEADGCARQPKRDFELDLGRLYGLHARRAAFPLALPTPRPLRFLARQLAGSYHRPDPITYFDFLHGFPLMRAKGRASLSTCRQQRRCQRA